MLAMMSWQADPVYVTVPFSTGLFDSSGSEGNLEMVKLLVERGIDVEARCSDGKTAVHYATQYGHDHLVHYLLQDSSRDLVNQADAAGWTPLHYAAEQGCLQLVDAFLQVGR